MLIHQTTNDYFHLNSFFGKKQNNAALLCTYTPLIKSKNNKTFSVFINNGLVYCEVVEKQNKLTLEVRGYPKLIENDLEKLGYFFSQCHFLVEKTVEGEYSFVRAVPSLKGGMIGQQDTLPMYPGYAIGSVIKKEKLLIPILDKKRVALEEELRQTQIEKEEMLQSQKYDSANGQQQQMMLLVYDGKILPLRNKHEQICKQINENYQSIDWFSNEEMLPLDHRISQVRIENRSFSSERLSHTVFYQNDVDKIVNKIEQFVSKLFLHDVPSSYLSSSAVETVANNIGDLLKKETKVSLVGSFITLPQVRVMDPIVIRASAKLSPNLIKEAENYYVLTEAVLGAVFLGFGTSFKAKKGIDDPDDLEENREAFLSSISTVSFISQGAIPTINANFKDVNLWSTYCNWKEKLLSDENSGYPIGFKFRNLSDVFEENKQSNPQGAPYFLN